MRSFVIDPELCKLIPGMTDEEYRQLETSIMAEGCREKLVVWNEGNILLDGHHRYWICTEHNIEFDIYHIALPHRQAVIQWMINNQLGRRNLTREQMGYLRGKRYHIEKTNGHGERSVYNNSTQNTRERLADEYGVSESLIAKDALYASEIDLIEQISSSEVAHGILNREIRISKKEVSMIAGIARGNDKKGRLAQPERALSIIDEVLAGTVASVRGAIKTIDNQDRKQCPKCIGRGYID